MVGFNEYSTIHSIGRNECWGVFYKKKGGAPCSFLSFVMYDFVWIFIRFALTQGTKKWGKKKTVLVIFYSSKE